MGETAMTVGQLTALAICVLGLGTYTSVRGLLVHIKLRQALEDRKNKKLPTEKTISILTLIAFMTATFLEDRMLNRTDLPVPELFIKVSQGVSAGLFLAVVMLIINHFKPNGIKRDERMLFLETGLLIIMSYLILSPAIMMIYLRLTIT